MASTTNYSWNTPDNSGLVKNGAQDMRTLGDAIDTSVWNIGYGQAGKNKIINGDFNIWQRGTTQAVIDVGAVYGSADRWLFGRNGTISTGTNTVSRETFTVGQTDVPNNPTFFCRWTTTTLGTSQTRIDVNQYMENVSTFAGQTATLSFYIKSSGTFGISTFVEQNFGSGGSALVTTTTGTGNTSTSWQRFTTTVAIPSITGKTVGANNFLRILIRVNSPTAGATFDFANAQLEYGSKATPFQTASGGSPQAELAMCQRYFQKSYALDVTPGTASTLGGSIMAAPEGVVSYKSFPNVIYPVNMRGSTTITIYNPSTGTAGLAAGVRNTQASTNIPLFVAYQTQNGFQSYIDNSSALVGAQLMFHYTASSEL
jgi:hypothetical protein